MLRRDRVSSERCRHSLCTREFKKNSQGPSLYTGLQLSWKENIIKVIRDTEEGGWEEREDKVCSKKSARGVILTARGVVLAARGVEACWGRRLSAAIRCWQNKQTQGHPEYSKQSRKKCLTYSLAEGNLTCGSYGSPDVGLLWIVKCLLWIATWWSFVWMWSPYLFPYLSPSLTPSLALSFSGVVTSLPPSLPTTIPPPYP